MPDEDSHIINETKKKNQNVGKADQTKRKQKKQRSESPAEPTTIPTEDLFGPLELEMNTNPNKYVLSYEQMKDLMENIKGSQESLNVAQEYTEDIDGLLTTMRQLYPLLEHKTIKSRFTRVMTKIKAHLKEELNEHNHLTNMSD